MHITIDNRQYEARAGDTILDVARREGIDIPTLCYEPHLSIAGACRMCLVTLEPDNRLVTACTTPVVEDMRVLTRNPETIEARRMMLDLLLSEHPLDCLVCEANGNCALQDLAYEYGISESSFGCPTGRHFELKSENPFIEVDPDKCIRCGKCIRVDHEVQAAFAIDFVNRGAITTVATPFEQDLAADTSTCVFCGQCVEICPTGALTYSPSKGRGRIYDFESTETICPYCGVGCRIILRTRDNQVIQVGTAPAEGCANPRGESCVKGRFGYEYVNHPDRLTTPLIRKDGELQPASWDEALTYTAQRLDEVRRQWGADAVAGLSSAKCTNEENYLMQKFMRAVIGTNNVDHCARLCHASTVAGLAQAFGSGAMTNSIGEI
ncbi:MAG: molybdopterin-dependent oxidoreductase, partial [Bacillota bacterium]